MRSFDLVFEMQRAALQVGDCQFIGRILKPRLGNFVLQGFAPAFQVFHLAWPHIFLPVSTLCRHPWLAIVKGASGCIEFIDLDQNITIPGGRGTASGPWLFAMCSGRLLPSSMRYRRGVGIGLL